jgi:hypothetical protein
VRAAARKNIAPLTNDDVEAAQDSPDEGIPRTESVGPPLAARLSYALGIPSVFLGIGGFALSWIPLVRSLGLLLGGLGLVLGIAGLIVSIIHKGKGLALPAAGSVFSVAALVITVYSLALAWKQQLEGVAPLVQAVDRPTNGSNAETKPDIPPPAKEVSWADATKGPVQLGDVRVKLGWVIVSNVKIKDELLGEEKVSDKKYLCIQVFVENLSATRKLDYRGWSGVEAGAPNLADLLAGTKDAKSLTETLAGAAGYAANLTDEARNVYKRIKLDPGSYVLGQVVSEKSVYPGQSTEDLLVFEPPVDKAQFLRLELPASTYRGTGTLRLQIPRSMVQR